MTNNHRYNHFVIFALILIVGLGLAFALPWLANAQGLAAQSGVPAQDLAPEADKYYVAITGTGAGGMSWTFAFTNVQDALAVAVATDEIWVAKGVYYPDEGSGQINDSITATFLMTDGVALYGGFNFGDTNINDRDWENNKTVLSGDVDGNDDTDTNDVVIDAANINGNNAYHVVTGSGVTITAVVDGFTITAGQADGSYSGYCGPPCGGGMYNYLSSPSLRDVVFSGNSADIGGGMYNRESSPVLTNVTFSGNSAVENGGGMYNYEGSPALTNVTFSGNSADEYGGGMNNDNSNPALTNVVFSGNSAGTDGGGMSNGLAIPTLTNVTFSGNSAVNYGGGMYNYRSSPDVRNSILWNNKDNSGTGTITATIYNDSATITLTHSLVQDSLPGGSWIGGSYVDGGDNIDQNPMFVTPINPSDAPTTTGNLRLQTSSPAIDKGNNIYVAGVLTDLDGEARIKDGDGDGTATVDMGAYEAATLYLLAVTKAGTGDGLVSSSPAGIDCGDTCSILLKENSSITLTATADGDSIFTGWSGACSGTADCMVTMDAAKTVTATFALEAHDNYLPILFK